MLSVLSAYRSTFMGTDECAGIQRRVVQPFSGGLYNHLVEGCMVTKWRFVARLCLVSVLLYGGGVGWVGGSVRISGWVGLQPPPPPGVG